MAGGIGGVKKRGSEIAGDLHEYRAPIERGSDKAFGFVFAVFFAVVGLYPLARGLSIRWWALAFAAVLAATAVARPRWLAPFNTIWTKLGLALNRVVSPVALFLVYCLAIVPTGLLLRALGKDPLRLRMDSKAPTYWISRLPPGRADDQMKRQF
jgi:hypothetical protein